MRSLIRSGRSRVFALTVGASVIAAGAGVLGTASTAGAAPGDQITRASTASGGKETTSTPCITLIIFTLKCETYTSKTPSVSPDGRFVAFQSNAWDLVPGVPTPEAALIELSPPGVSRVYLKDRVTQQTTLVSVKDNHERIDVENTNGVVNGDGTKVAFLSKGTDVSVVPSGGTGRPSVYLRDLAGGRTLTISNPNAAQNVFEFFGSGSSNPSISFDGNTVVYQSNDLQSVPGEVAGSPNVYIWTRNPSATSYPWGSTISVGAAANPRLSAGGRWLLVEKGGGMIRRDLTNGSEVVALNNGAYNGASYEGSISDDGDRIAFTSKATNLVPGDNNQTADVFVRTLSTGAIKRVSVSSTGQEFTKDSSGGRISGDGGWVAFNSIASLTGASTGGNNVFEANVGTGAVSLASVDLQGGGGGGDSAAINGDGAIVPFASASNLVADRTNQNGEVYVFDRNGAPSPFASGPLWMAAADGGVFSFGGAQFFGSMGATPLNKPVVGIAKTPTNQGYWLVASDGGIFSFGDAQFYGSTGNMALNKPIVGMASTASGHGYWLVAGDGGIFAFGDAPFHGSTGDIALNKPVVGMTASPSGNGYWFAASDGGIFSYGDAQFYGSTGNINLNKPINGMAATRAGNGYYLVASDGGIFAFNAPFFGSEGGAAGVEAIGMTLTSTDNGYRITHTDGTTVLFDRRLGIGGSSTGLGSLKPNKPMVGVAG